MSRNIPHKVYFEDVCSTTFIRICVCVLKMVSRNSAWYVFIFSHKCGMVSTKTKNRLVNCGLDCCVFTPKSSTSDDKSFQSGRKKWSRRLKR